MNNEQRMLIRRNKLVGMWAAEKLGLTDTDAEAYSDALAIDAMDAQRANVLETLRKDFHDKGVIQSDAQILAVMNEFLREAAGQMNTKKGDSQDAATVMIARNLMQR